MKEDSALIKKLLVVIIFVITISIIGFVGIYTKNLNKMSNLIPDYNFSSEFEGVREYQFSLDNSESEKEMYIDKDGNISGEVKKDDSSTSSGVEVSVEGDANAETNNGTDIEGYTRETRTIKANEDSVLTLDSYKKSKSIIEKRLEDSKVEEYSIRLDEVTGNLVVELADNENAAFFENLIESQGEFKIIDSQTGLELMNNKHVDSASAVYDNSNGSYTVYLQIKFNKDGAKILNEMSEKYIEKEVEKKSEETTNTTENTNTTEVADGAEDTNTTESESDTSSEEPETEISYIEIQMDGTTLMKTYFGEDKLNGTISIPLSSNITESKDLVNSLKSASAISTLLNEGKLPNKYSLKNDDFLKSTIIDEDINNIKIAFAVAIITLSVALLMKFGLNGLIGAILNVGYLAIVSIAIRYTNVVITISSIITSVLIIALNFVFIYNFLSKLKNDKKASVNFSDTIKSLYITLVPILIVAIVYTFMSNATITGIGMILFWGLMVHILYSLIFVRSVYVLNDK